MEKKTQQLHLKQIDGEPVFRIHLFENQEMVDFKVGDQFTVEDADGNPLIKNVKSNLRWRVKTKTSSSGKVYYYLVLYETFDPLRAEAKLASARKIAPEAKLLTLGGDIFLNDKKVNSNTKYCVVVGEFSSELSAKRHIKRFRPEFSPRVEKAIAQSGTGEIEIFDAEYENSAETANAVRIVPKNFNTKIKLYNIRGFDGILQKEYYKDHVYNGTIEFRIDPQGRLMAISELPLESYLKRVVYSEIGTELPLEFSKSLAIVCRSEVMARIGHKHLGAPYDMCNWGHCLRYYGDDFEDQNIEAAIEQTRGQVIVARDLIVDTYFNLICGGHTEDASGVWEIDEEPFFHGKYDWTETPKEFANLQEDDTVRRWIHARPEAWCNLRGRQVPDSLEKAKQYFRWEVNYSRRELEEIIRKKTGEDLGDLFDVVPIQRGASGRLKEVELMGSLKNYRLRGELSIREALAHDYLPSSCFYVEKEMDETGTPYLFTFVGAGQGHGVGMCKTGGAVMAMEGYTCEQILNHYFEDCNLESIYKMEK